LAYVIKEDKCPPDREALEDAVCLISVVVGLMQGSGQGARGDMLAGDSADLNELVAAAGGHAGVVWTLEDSGDLNANLVRFDTGGGVGEHVNDEVDVVFVGVAGSGFVRVDGEEHVLSAGKLVFVPRGARRSTCAPSDGFAYLTVHRRRAPLRIGG
jgi:quercetin dioxygenase-like cupin family protein